MAGETGEACNLIKKLRRGEAVRPETIGEEIADVVIYADLLAARLGLDLGECVRAKFNLVSVKRGSHVPSETSVSSRSAAKHPAENVPVRV